MIVKSMVLEKYKKWLIYSFSYIIRKTSVCVRTIVNSRVIAFLRNFTFYFNISIHSKKNGSSVLKPNKIKGCRCLT